MKIIGLLLASLLAMLNPGAAVSATNQAPTKDNVRMLYCGDFLGTAFVVGRNVLATARHLTHGRTCVDASTGAPIQKMSEDEPHDFALVSMETGAIQPLHYTCGRYKEGDLYNAFGFGRGEATHRFLIPTKQYSIGDWEVMPGMRIVLGEMVHGMSGGPVFDKYWNAIGMVNASDDHLSFSFELADTPLCKRK